MTETINLDDFWNREDGHGGMESVDFNYNNVSSEESESPSSNMSDHVESAIDSEESNVIAHGTCPAFETAKNEEYEEQDMDACENNNNIHSNNLEPEKTIPDQNVQGDTSSPKDPEQVIQVNEVELIAAPGNDVYVRIMPIYINGIRYSSAKLQFVPPQKYAQLPTGNSVPVPIQNLLSSANVVNMRLEPMSTNNDDEPDPYYVNPKQYNRILKRREARAKLVSSGRIPEIRGKATYIHESRHLHAKKRARAHNGRFSERNSAKQAKVSPNAADEVQIIIKDEPVVGSGNVPVPDNMNSH